MSFVILHVPLLISMDESYVDVQEELDALQAIYEESLSVNETYPQRIGIALRPHTAEDATIQVLENLLNRLYGVRLKYVLTR